MQFLTLNFFAPSDGAPSVIPAVLSAALRRERHPAQEHRHVRRRFQQGQGARPHPEAVPG